MHTTIIGVPFYCIKTLKLINIPKQDHFDLHITFYCLDRPLVDLTRKVSYRNAHYALHDIYKVHKSNPQCQIDTDVALIRNYLELDSNKE